MRGCEKPPGGRTGPGTPRRYTPLPSLLAALDSDVDAWRAIQVARYLPYAADQLVPGLGDHLRRTDLSQERTKMSANAILAAMAALGDPAAIDVMAEVLRAAVRHE